MKRSASRNHVLVFLTALAAACGGEAEPPAPAAPTPNAAPSATDASPAPPSPIETARELLDAAVNAETSLDRLLDVGQEVRAWGAKQSVSEATGEALLLAAQLELTAIGAAAARDGANRRAGAGLADFESRLRAMAKLPEALGPSHEGYEAARRVAEAGLVALSTNSSVKDVELDLGSARALALSGTREGLVIRALWMSRVETALATLMDQPPELHTSTVVPLVGRMLCGRCADAHHITPDKVTHFLLNPSNSGGMICDTALQVGRSAKTPPMEIAALSSCENLRRSRGPSEPTLLWGTNVIVVNALRLGYELANAAPGQSTLSPLIATQAKRVKDALAQPVRLPMLTPSAPVAESNLTAPWNASIAYLRAGGMSVDAPSDGVFFVAHDGVRVGLRPTVAMEEGEIVSRSVQLGLPGAGREILSGVELESTSVDSESGIRAISSAVAELKTAIPRIGGKAAAPTELVVDARAKATSVAKVLDALRVAGVHHVRFAKTSSHGHTFPVLVRDEAPGLRTRFGESLDRSLTAVVSEEHIDLWLPKGVKGKRDGDLAAFTSKIGDQVRRGYRGKKLVRLRLPLGLGGDTGLGSVGAKALSALFASAASRLDVSSVLHVVSRGEARAADVLAVASNFQERDGRPLDDPGSLWPGARCGGRAYTLSKRTPKGCATAVAIAFSTKPPPSNAGIRQAPDSGEVAKEKPKKAEAGFCDKKDIAKRMKKRRGSFRFCYERELRMDKDLSGRVTMSFQIGSTGAVKGAPRVVSSSLGSKTLHQCLGKNIQKITFGKPDGGTCTVRWPFVFQPK